MNKGSCLCGGITYETDDDLNAAMNCHCQYCRRAHGSSYVTAALLPSSKLRVTSGESLLAGFDIGKGRRRCFCRVCGTRIFNVLSVPGFVALMTGTLENPDIVVPRAHVNLESKSEHFVIHDTLPQFAAFPTQAEMAKIFSS